MEAGLLPHLRAAKDLADRHFDRELNLDTLAAAANVSRYHFVRCFADAYGETPMRYLTRRRVERAQDLLCSANLTVTEISLLVGYQSLGSFCTRFRTLVGVSPTQYRRGAAADPGSTSRDASSFFGVSIAVMPAEETAISKKTGAGGVRRFSP